MNPNFRQPLVIISLAFALLSACQPSPQPSVNNSNIPTQAQETKPEPTEPPPTATPYPAEITDAMRVSMAVVPAGEFIMGSDSGEPEESPAHTVYLDAYYIDIYEVTNALYRDCVDEGVCQRPRETGSYDRVYYYDETEFDNYPVISVDWNQAKAYCEWRGARLPTEAEWEKAARGVDGDTYPWGEEPDCSKASYNDCQPDTTPVGSYDSGVSPYGLYDMAGNVWEWVADWYSETYFQNSPSSNPLGPESGEFRVLKGGSWAKNANNMRAAYRTFFSADRYSNLLGFRCALTP
jgi:formylglycine-generating enzyme required for sulfatase activity